MALKKCSYKGCRSVNTPDNPSRETFFQFPKDETRYELWMAMSRCEDRSKSTKYLCSKHFDHSKYMSSNPRRNLLLATAVPYPYQSDSEESEEEEELDQIQDVVSAQYEDQNFFPIRGRMENETGSEQVVADETGIVLQFADVVVQSDFSKTLHQQTEQRKISKPEVIEYYRKRKLPEAVSEEPTNVKVVKIRSTQSQTVKTAARREVSLNVSSNNINIKTTNVPEVIEEDFEIDPSVTTFIYKGEEYIQMPKKCYVEEKVQLMREVQYYKDIVINFKNLLENVKS